MRRAKLKRHENDHAHDWKRALVAALVSRGCPPFQVRLLAGYRLITIWIHCRSFPSCLKPLFEREAKCVAIDMNVIFYSHANETHYCKKGWKWVSLELGNGPFETGEKQIQLVIWTGLAPSTTRLWVRRTDHSTTRSRCRLPRLELGRFTVVGAKAYRITLLLSKKDSRIHTCYYC